MVGEIGSIYKTVRIISRFLVQQDLQSPTQCFTRRSSSKTIFNKIRTNNWTDLDEKQINNKGKEQIQICWRINVPDLQLWKLKFSESKAYKKIGALIINKGTKEMQGSSKEKWQGSRKSRLSSKVSAFRERERDKKVWLIRDVNLYGWSQIKNLNLTD